MDPLKRKFRLAKKNGLLPPKKIMDFLKKKYWTAPPQKKIKNCIGATICNNREIQCLPYVGFFLRIELDWRAFVELRISNFEKQKSFFEKKYLILFLDILKKWVLRFIYIFLWHSLMFFLVVFLDYLLLWFFRFFFF